MKVVSRTSDSPDKTCKEDEEKMLEDNNRQSEDIVLSPKDLINASDPNVVLTNPLILSHLQQLHDRATRRCETVQEDDETEQKHHLHTKVTAFNKRSQVGAFRVKLAEGTDSYFYSGPLKFSYQAPGTKHESFRLMTLTDQDSVKGVLPKLRQKFAIPEEQRCTIREMINGDEILLDPDDRPLELAVNSKSPLTFHLITGSDRNTELLKNLRSESFTPQQRRTLIEKFNLRSEEENDGINSSGRSSTSSPRRTSLSGSSTGGSMSKKSREIKRGSTSPSLAPPMPKLNGYNGVSRKSSFKETTATPLKTVNSQKKFTRSNTLPKDMEHAVDVLPPSGGQASTRSGRVRNLKNKRDANSNVTRRDSRSSSARKLFFSLRKYRPRSSSRDRSGSKSLSQLPSDLENPSSPTKTSELSSDVNLPGILKIFGDAVSPGANYKSVMATANSNARELVKMALERYGIARHQAKYHVLCEVVGRVTEEKNKDGVAKALKIKAKKTKRKSIDSPLKGMDGDFIEDYVRPLSDQEKPLVLQSYWKPLDGHCRRFEIRRRSKVFKKIEKDHSTRDINMQAKKLVMQKSRNNLIIPSLFRQPQTDSEEEDGEKITSFDLRRSPDPETAKEKSESTPYRSQENLAKPEALPKEEVNVLEKVKTCTDVEAELATAITDRVTPDGGAADSSVKSETNNDSKPSDSPPCPYLITLQGNEDSLIHSLDKQEVLIGSEVTDFKLLAPDISRHHCVIKRRLEIIFSEADSYEALKRWCVTITPLSSNAELRINGSIIASKHTLQHGELLSIGQHHMFMYKDPSSHINLSNVVTFSFSKSNTKESDLSSTGALGSNISVNSAHLKPSSPSSFIKVIQTDLSYDHELEDGVLNEIFDSAREITDVSEECPLAPAILLCQCITHCCLNFEMQYKNDLLLKIASNLQTLVLNATRNVSVQEIQSSTEANENAHLLPLLRPVVYWMSNSLEIFEYLQKDLIPIIQRRVEEEKKKGLVDPELLRSAESYVVNEEILALLEEVVMYAFQQIVYYLTKTLYGSLPAILECNPFAEESSSNLRVSHITDVYASARDMTQMYDVNERITDQLFAYLFFFTNVSLFNTLMEEDASTKYYRWEMGVRIRGNLEHIESWATESGYMDQCTMYLEKISALANLLATPRGQIVKGSWPSFRENFPALAPAQLQKVLSGYHIPGNPAKPKSWNPNADDMESALDAELTMESYDNHPPLMLPVAGSKINFRLLPSDPWFQDLYRRVKVITNTSSDDDVSSSRQRANIVREQPDGRELSNSDHSSSPKRRLVRQGSNVSSFSKKDASHEEDLPLYVSTSGGSFNGKEIMLDGGKETDLASLSGGGRIVSSSSCSTSSEPEAYVIRQHRSPHQQRKISDVTIKPSDAINDLVQSNEIGKDCDEFIVLPVAETTSLMSHLSSNKSPSISRTPSTASTNLSVSSHASSQGMPKEVFIVDIKRGKKGLGVGLVDGVVTLLGAPGIYVRSLIPDGGSSKHTHTKHHDVLRCWLQEGRLQLGDRILAANGVSLINMTYYEAMRTVRQAGDNVRLLVGRCGSEVAMKITSSSC